MSPSLLAHASPAAQQRAAEHFNEARTCIALAASYRAAANLHRGNGDAGRAAICEKKIRFALRNAWRHHDTAKTTLRYDHLGSN